MKSRPPSTPSSIVRALLGSSIDYAGLFPPAKLELWDALRRYFDARRSRHAWLVDRFVLPHALLFELERQADAFLEGMKEAPIHLNVILPAREWEGAIEDVWGFNERWLGRAAVSAFEAPPLDAREITRLVTHLPLEFPAFFEIPAADAAIEEKLAAIAASNRGAKVRTGGLAPGAIPSSGDLAGFIVACAAARVPFKATAGLHHALPGARTVHGESGDFDARMHGFLNLAVAACAAHGARADREAIRSILDSDDPGGLVSGRDVSPDEDAIRAARRELFVSFGSCSIDDPAEELEALGLA